MRAELGSTGADRVAGRRRLAEGLPDPTSGSAPDGGEAAAVVPMHLGGGAEATWTATAGTSGDAVVLHLGAGRAARGVQADEVVAQRLSAALGMPVLTPLHRTSDRSRASIPADVLTAFDSLCEYRPSSFVVVIGHDAGADLVPPLLSALAGSGRPMPAAAVLLAPSGGDGVVDPALGGAPEPGRDAPAAPAPVSARSALDGDLTAYPPAFLGFGAGVARDDLERLRAGVARHGSPTEAHAFDGWEGDLASLDPDATRRVLDQVRSFVLTRLRGVPAAPPAAPLTIRRVGWAGYVVTTERGTRVLVDPYQSGTEGIHSGIPESPIPWQDLTDVDVVAVTHAGYDHRGQCVEIVSGGSAQLVCGPAVRQDAVTRGVDPARCAIMVSGVEYRFRDVVIKALDARHASTMVSKGRELDDQPMSFLLTTDAGSRIFCGGDTSISDDLKTWGRLFEPTVAVLGISGVHVGPVKVVELHPDEAAAAATWLGVDTVIPVHHPQSGPEPAQLTAELAALGADVEVVPLAFGATWTAPVGGTPA